MKNNKSLVIIIISVLLVGLGVYLYSSNNQGSLETNNNPDLVSDPATNTNVEPDPSANMPAEQTVNNPSFVEPEKKQTSSPSAEVSIDIADFAYSPQTVTVKKGTRVTWTNKDSAAHTVTADTEGPSSELLKQNEKFTYTFDKVGTFNYYCIPHPWMKASVVVTE